MQSLSWVLTWSTDTTLPVSLYQNDSGRRTRTCNRAHSNWLINLENFQSAAGGICHTFHHMTHDLPVLLTRFSSHCQQSRKRTGYRWCWHMHSHYDESTYRWDKWCRCNAPVSLSLGHKAACPLCCLLLLRWVELFDQRRLCHPQVLPCKIESNKLYMEYMADQDHANQARISYPCSAVLACLSSPFIPLSPLSALTVNTRRGAHRAAGPAQAASNRVASAGLRVVNIVTQRSCGDVTSAQ